MDTQALKKKILPILKRREVIKTAIFGSFVAGKISKNSDIDLLVKLKKGNTLLDLMKLKTELEKSLKRTVDLVTYDSLHPLLKDIILQEQEVIYEKRS